MPNLYYDIERNNFLKELQGEATTYFSTTENQDIYLTSIEYPMTWQIKAMQLNKVYSIPTIISNLQNEIKILEEEIESILSKYIDKR